MVERFRNGDASNDPRPEDMEWAYPGFVPEGWAITPWSHDWYAPDPYFAALDTALDSQGYPLERFEQKAQLRRYGGDLQGVIDQLDYLDSLGVTAVYFNPLNDAPSLHKYDPRYWHHIDRNFGPDPAGDRIKMQQEQSADPASWVTTTADSLFIQLIDLMHQRGMRLIMDYSWNHTGAGFWALDDLRAKQNLSPYVDWYWLSSFDNPATPENEFAWKGWMGVPSLPEIRETVTPEEHHLVKAYEGDLYSESVKQHIFAVTRRWMDPNGDGDPSDGVDGFRLDVAGELPLGFWREYRQVVRNLNPDAYLIGEIWWEEWPDKLLDPAPFLQGDVFDAVMNYRWYRAARHYFNQSPDELSTPSFIDSLQRYAEGMRPISHYSMMNVAASHDAPRLATSLFNKNKYKFQTNPSDNAAYLIHKPDTTTWQTQQMLLIHQFTYIGAPHIWAGDEMGMWGSDDPSTRKPLIWPDITFDPEKAHPLGLQRPVDTVAFDAAKFRFYQQLVRLRKAHPVLSHGGIEFIEMPEAHNLLVYRRYDGKDEVFVLFNTGELPRTVTLKSIWANPFREVVQSIPVVQTDKNIQIELPPRTGAILVTDKK
ncbi:MAG: alpha-amylase family glycosyl hydrolase [Saprospiraceae bacterium]